MKSNLEFLKPAGLHGLLALGSTGDFLHLEPEVRKRVMERVAALAGPWRLLLNISDIRPSVVADLGRFAKSVGAAAVSLLPPSFYPSAQEDLVPFFARAAEAARLPLFLYNFPERTGTRIALETVASVADCVQVAGVKQSGNEFSYHADLAELGREKGFVVLTGADTRLPKAAALGAAGCVSGLSNAVPELLVRVWSDLASGSAPNSAMATHQMAELGRRIQGLAFPLDVAAAMEARGLAVGSPKRLLSQATQIRYANLVTELRSLFREWELPFWKKCGR